MKNKNIKAGLKKRSSYKKKGSNANFSNARKLVFSTIEAARDCAWQREVIGTDEGSREGGDEGRGDKGRGE